MNKYIMAKNASKYDTSNMEDKKNMIGIGLKALYMMTFYMNTGKAVKHLQKQKII